MTLCLLSYTERALDAERRLRKGERQGQCKRCRLWFWADEIAGHPCEPVHFPKVRNVVRS